MLFITQESTRRCSCDLFKYSIEIIWRTETNIEGYLLHCFASIGKQFYCTDYTLLIQITVETYS